TLETVTAIVPSHRLIVTPSCSLLHVPYDAGQEMGLDAELRGWLAFAEQKLAEVTTLTRGLDGGRSAIAAELQASAAIQEDRTRSPRVHDAAVQRRMAESTNVERPPFAQRQAAQHARLNLPPLPTTTIGSFPQTTEVRRMRRRFESGEIDAATYDRFIEDSIA